MAHVSRVCGTSLILILTNIFEKYCRSAVMPVWWRRWRSALHCTYRITARPQFRVKLAACGGRAAATVRRVAPEIVFGRGRTGSGAALQSPCGRARAPASPASRPDAAPHEYPGDRRALRFTNRRRCAYFGRERAPGRVGRCPRAGRRALVVVCGAAAAGRALRASPRPPRRAALRPRCGRCGRMQECAPKHHRVDDAAADDCSTAPTHWSVQSLHVLAG